MAVSTVRVTPPVNRTSVMLAGGRVYTCAYGSSIDVPDWAANQLEANGWQVVNADITANRPTNARQGAIFLDTTLGKVIKHDGAVWHDLITGAVV